MKFKIKKNILLEGLNNVSKALSNRNIIPVLNGILFNLTDKGLSLTATDNDLTIKTFIDKSDIINIDSEGSVVIIGRYVLDIIRKLPCEEVEIEEIEGGKAIISTPNAKYNLNCFDINDFPKIDIVENDKPIKLLTGKFKEIVNQTVFSTSMQESRPLLTGINLKIIGNLLETVATDSYRLSKKIIKLDKNVDNNINIVIPAKNVIELIKIIENEESELVLYCFNNKILFKYENILFQSSLLNGTYPNTDTLIPTEFQTKLQLNLNDFYDVVDRAALLTQVKDKNIVQLELKDNNIIITSSSPEIGKVEEVMPIKALTGPNIKISFSAKFMMDALKSFTSEEVIIMLNGDIKPIIIKESEDGDLTQLILPIKTY